MRAPLQCASSPGCTRARTHVHLNYLIYLDLAYWTGRKVVPLQRRHANSMANIMAHNISEPFAHSLATCKAIKYSISESRATHEPHEREQSRLQPMNINIKANEKTINSFCSAYFFPAASISLTLSLSLSGCHPRSGSHRLYTSEWVFGVAFVSLSRVQFIFKT